MNTSPLEIRPVVLGRYRYSKWRWRLLVGLFDMVGTVLARIWRMFRPKPIVSEPRRILVVQLDHLGDAVLSSVLFPRLREAYPEAMIDVLASPSNREVFANDPTLNHVHVASRTWFERKPGRFALWSAVFALGRRLRCERYDLGIDVRGDILTVLVLAIAAIPRRAGWSMGGGGFLLTDVAAWVPGRHEVLSRLAILETLGIGGDAPAKVSVTISAEDRLEVSRALREAWPDRSHRALSMARVGGGPGVVARSNRNRPEEHDEPEWLHAGRFGAEAPLLAIHLGAGTAAKRWPIAHWRLLIEKFLSEGWRVVVVGGVDDAELAGSLDRHSALRDWTGRFALAETAALLERADLFIGPDSGPAHLAACAGVPSVVLFSGTNRAAQWRPWSRRSMVVRHRVPCGPCHRKICPLVDHPCMTGITPERIHRAAKWWWARLNNAESPHAPF